VGKYCAKCPAGIRTHGQAQYIDIKLLLVREVACDYL
jgi:hypothetical protein